MTALSTMRTLTDAFPTPFAVIDARRTIVAANQAMRDVLGEDIVDRHYTRACRRPSILDAVGRAFGVGATEEAEFSENIKGRTSHFKVICSPLEVEGRAHVSLSFEDVTSSREIRAMRSDFVANVSHELKTPITSILGFVETIQGPAANDEAARNRFLSLMAREAERMNRLVHDLLSLNRVEVDEKVRPMDRVALNALVSHTAEVLQPLAEARGISLKIELPDAPCHVTGHERQLVQVLRNLAENAIAYSPSGNEVRVRLTAPAYEVALHGNGVRLIIEDDGQGIDPVHIPRLTERFYRVDSHRSREVGGTGLGLAIVKHIITRHRGRLEIKSKLGIGSRFTGILPADTSAP